MVHAKPISAGRSPSPTMKQIAARAGVSAMTVSRALHDTSVSAQTRSRVLRAAAKLGYRLNTAAQSVSSGRFNAVSLLVDADLARDHLPPHLLYGVQAALDEHGQRLILTHLSDEELTSDEHVPTILTQLAADGLLINYKHQVPTRLAELLEQYAVPSVWIDTDRSTDSVMADHAGSGRTAVEYLRSLGHTRIAFADHHPADEMDEHQWHYHFSIPERRGGYVAAMRDAGLVPQLFNRPKGVQDERDDRIDIARMWLEESDRPTAIICYVMATAIPVYVAATAMGLRVPEDLSIIGCSSQGQTGGLSMTRMQLPEHQIGRNVVEMLIQRIEQPTQSIPSRRLPLQLVQGRTCGPPRGDQV